MDINSKWFKPVPSVDVYSDTPSQDIQDAAGEKYISDVVLKLALRKILEKGNTASLTHVQKRSVLPFLKTGFNFVVKAAASGELSDFFKGLFTGEKGILSTLAAFRASSPEDRKEFSQLSNKVSQFEAETRKLFVDVLKNTEDIETQLKELQNDQFTMKKSTVSFNEMLLTHQVLLSDLTRLLLVSNVYWLHFEAFSDCRSGKISPTFVPLALLVDKLKELEANMPADKELLISPADANRYFKLTIAECLYDSGGGVVKIGVPLRNKQSAYQLYEFKPMQFAYNEYTCSLETPATLLIKDLNSNDVFPITELDIDFCEVSSGLCKLPLSTDMDTFSICIGILVKGSSAAVIKENCKLQCTKRMVADISKLNDDLYIGTHLPPQGIEVRCGEEIYPVTAALSIGSTLFSLSCTNCKIFFYNRVVGTSSGTKCKEDRRPAVTTLLPIQFSDLADMKPDSEDGMEKTVFTGASEIVNQHYDPETGTNLPSLDIWPYLINFLTTLWDTIQSLAIAYIFYRNNYLPPFGVVLGNHVVGGLASPVCNLTPDVYYLLWAILTVVLLIFVPRLVIKSLTFFKNLYNESVRAAAERERERQRRAIPMRGG